MSVSFTLRPFTPRERASGTHSIGGRVDPRAGAEKGKIWPYRDSYSDPSVVQPVASRYTDYTNPAPHVLPRIHEISRYVKSSIYQFISLRPQYSPKRFFFLP
jgi:hypothetical protein